VYAHAYDTLILSFRLLATLIIQPASPFGAGVVCQQVPGIKMTEVQEEMCKENPNIIHIMFNYAVRVFKHHCYNSFKDHQWNCRGIDPPMFATVQKFLTLGELHFIKHKA